MIFYKLKIISILKLICCELWSLKRHFRYFSFLSCSKAFFSAAAAFSWNHIFVKLCVHFVSVCLKVQKWTLTDTFFTRPPTLFFLSVCFSFCLFFFLSVYLFVCFSFCLFCLFFVLSVFRFVCFLFVCFSFCRFFVLSVFLFVCFAFCLLFFMSVFLFVKKGGIGSRKFWPEGEILGIFLIEVAP